MTGKGYNTPQHGVSCETFGTREKVPIGSINSAVAVSAFEFLRIYHDLQLSVIVLFFMLVRCQNRPTQQQ